MGQIDFGPKKGTSYVFSKGAQKRLSADPCGITRLILRNNNNNNGSHKIVISIS